MASPIDYTYKSLADAEISKSPTTKHRQEMMEKLLEKVDECLEQLKLIALK